MWGRRSCVRSSALSEYPIPRRYAPQERSSSSQASVNGGSTSGIRLWPATPSQSMEQAAAVGVPYLAAWSGLMEAARLQSGETVLIVGVSGAVGRAATQIAQWKNAEVIGADRKMRGHARRTRRSIFADCERGGIGRQILAE